MSFASIEFILFFIAVILITLIIEKRFSGRVKEIFLLAASYFFYAYWDWRFCLLLVFVTLTAFFSAKAKESRPALAAGIVVLLTILGFFKYFNFFLSSAAALIGRELGALKIILPLGISFYIFSAISYMIDVHRGKTEAESDFVRLALYISFFPKLEAGPIVRAQDFLGQLKEERHITSENFKYGIQIFVFGLFKKIVLADHISVFVNDVYAKPAAFHWATILLAAVSYSVQIYFDFSGYSDMAVGCARCLGYEFQYTVYFSGRHGILEKMAYKPVHLAQGLSLYSPWREP